MTYINIIVWFIFLVITSICAVFMLIGGVVLFFYAFNLDAVDMVITIFKSFVVMAVFALLLFIAGLSMEFLKDELKELRHKKQPKQ